ncbi:MAG: hypothetical protein ACOYM2_00380 [Rectinemataceae bacterium]
MRVGIPPRGLLAAGTALFLVARLAALPADLPDAADLADFGLAPRLSPSSRVVLVLSLPEPEILPLALHPDLPEFLSTFRQSAAPMPALAQALAEPAPVPSVAAAATASTTAAPTTAAATVPTAAAGSSAAAKVALPAAAALAAAGTAASPPPAAAKKPTKVAPAAPPSLAVPQKKAEVAALVEVVPASPASLAPLVKASEPVAPTRSLAAEVGQQVEVPFVGTGWVYLGERDAKDGVQYVSRRFEGSGALFAVAALKAGDYNLRFMKQDLERGTSSDEIVRLSVAPKGSGALAPAPVKVPTGTSAAKAAGGSNDMAAAPGAARAVAADSPEGLLATARAELAANKGETALAALERLLVLAPGGSDELYWLLGQALETNGPKRDVKAAFAAYSKLLDFWPRSTWYRQAKDRAAYIERYYLEIR